MTKAESGQAAVTGVVLTFPVVAPFPEFPGSDPLADFSAAEIAWIFSDDPERAARFMQILEEELARRGLPSALSAAARATAPAGRPVKDHAAHPGHLHSVGGDTA